MENHKFLVTRSDMARVMTGYQLAKLIGGIVRRELDDPAYSAEYPRVWEIVCGNPEPRIYHTYKSYMMLFNKYGTFYGNLHYPEVKKK